jgi:DNA-binding LytR/AlgR family response regulator
MIRCLAIDDEPLALDLLEDNIRQVPFLQLVKRCKNAIEALEILQTEEIDLLFLDIQMPGITGTQFLKDLKIKPMVIFITAYKKYAVDGFELDVLDYLVKPVSFERFLKSANKALTEEFNRSNWKSPCGDYIFVNAEYNLVKIIINDIVYIEGMKDYIKIFLVNSPRPVITRLSMKVMEEFLSPVKFVRTHKSYLISVDKIISIRRNRILLENNMTFPLSDHYRESLFSIIDKKSLLR